MAAISRTYIFDGQSYIMVPFFEPTWPDRFMAGRPRAQHFLVGAGGTTYAQRTAAGRLAPVLGLPFGHPVTLISDGGESDIMADLTAAQVIAAMKSYHDAARVVRPDVRIAGPTIPVASSAWYSAGQLAVLAQVNTLLRANPAAAGLDVLVDVAALPQLADPLDTRYRYDQLHYTALAAKAVADLWLAAPV